jgi:hypothetical protein
MKMHNPVLMFAAGFIAGIGTALGIAGLDVVIVLCYFAVASLMYGISQVFA